MFTFVTCRRSDCINYCKDSFCIRINCSLERPVPINAPIPAPISVVVCFPCLWSDCIRYLFVLLFLLPAAAPIVFIIGQTQFPYKDKIFPLWPGWYTLRFYLHFCVSGRTHLCFKGHNILSSTVVLGCRCIPVCIIWKHVFSSVTFILSICLSVCVSVCLFVCPPDCFCLSVSPHLFLLCMCVCFLSMSGNVSMCSHPSFSSVLFFHAIQKYSPFRKFLKQAVCFPLKDGTHCSELSLNLTLYTRYCPLCVS